jgi:Dyp-type peroxidase family
VTPADATPADGAELELADIQGLVFYAYRYLAYAAYLPVRMTDGARARAWLRGLVESNAITNAEHRASDHLPKSALNLALSVTGLQKLGIAEGALATFPSELVDGMADPDRARGLGDIGESAPERWVLGNEQAPVDALLCLFAGSEGALRADVEARVVELQAHALTLSTGEPLYTTPRTSNEHFGFRDGISQPSVLGGPPGGASPQAPLQPGEFVLDYEDEYGTRPMPPSVAPEDDPDDRLVERGGRRLLGRNGSYLVFRQLAQDVAGFWRYVAEQATRMHGDDSPANKERVAAKMLGRWQNGDPLVPGVRRTTPPEPPTNDFVYAGDPRGLGCPLGSHVRRANPRDGLPPDAESSLTMVARHRIVRRGRAYGPPVEREMPTADDGEERGLFFLCINADIRRQFEFVQQTWLNEPTFGGLQNEQDPLLGSRRERPEAGAAVRADELTIPADPYRHKLEGVPRFVRVRGGAYLFLPALRALRYLARTGAPMTTQREPDADTRPHVLRDLWRSVLAEGKVLADDLENLYELTAEHVQNWSTDPDRLRPLFAALREHDPILVAPKLAIVTRYADVKEVLENRTGAFRVTEVYAARMARNTGAFMLGMEDTLQYRREARIARLALGQDAPERARAIVAADADRRLDAAGGRIDLVADYTRPVAARVIEELFGVPGPDLETLVRWMRVIFWDIFLNQTDLPDVRAGADRASRELDAYFDELIAEKRRSPGDDTLSRLLAMQRDPDTRLEDEAIKRTLGGIIVGGADSISKTASQSIAWLIDHPEHLETARRAAADGDRRLLERVVFEALRFAPEAPVLLRWCGQDTVVAAGTPRAKTIPAGTLVVVATLSANFDPAVVADPDAFRVDRPDFELMLFGYGQHRCLGWQLNLVELPELASRLLLRGPPRRAEGPKGRMVYEGPFPDHMLIEVGTPASA